ncbi:hypothetical protein WHT83_14170 [Aminobacter sp. P9b]|uniref:hypothetical protein n=1 Tax=Aminobacter sp. P9b TaxID=3133697 RepID=UPI0032443CFA
MVFGSSDSQLKREKAAADRLARNINPAQPQKGRPGTQRIQKLKRGWEKDLKLEQSTRAKLLKNWRE